MSADKAAVEEVPVGAAAKPSFGARVKAHYKKWWWAHLIGFIVVVLVVVLPVVYVGYPNIAQHDIDDSTLTVKSMVISDPAPDGFQLDQTQVIGSDSKFHPKIYSFEADIGLGGSPTFATVSVPQVKADDGTEVHVEQWVDLSNADAFSGFAKAVMMNEEFDLTVYGKPKLKQGGLPKITVTYDKTVTMKGLNKLSGFSVETMSLDPRRADGNNANGTVFIPNPTVMTLSMGNLTLDLSSNGIPLGQSFLNDLVLTPGDHTYPMVAKLNQTLLLNIVGQLKGDLIIPLTIVGNSSVYYGQEIPYFTAALAANTLNIDLDIAKVLGD